MSEEKKEEERGASINIGFGLDGLLDQLANFAAASGSKEARERVAEVKQRLGGLSGTEEGAGPQVESGFNIGGINLGGIFENILGGVGKIVNVATQLQEVQQGLGPGSVQEFNVGGKKGVIAFGTRIGSVADLTPEGAGNFKPEPVKTAVTPTPPPAESDSAQEPAAEFRLEVMEESKYVLVYGVVPVVASKDDIHCAVEGKVLTVTVNNVQHEIQLPAEVNIEQATASYTNGVFSVRLPKV